MRIRDIYTGNRPFSYVLFNSEDTVAADAFLDCLDDGGYRYWLCPKLTPGEKDLRELLGKLKSASILAVVLTDNLLEDRLAIDIIEYAIAKRTPFVVYMTVETNEIMAYLNVILEKAKSAVVFRAWEQEFNKSYALKQVLSQTKGITESDAAEFYEKGIAAIRDEESTPEMMMEGMKNISYAATNEYGPALNFLGNLALEKARNGYGSYSTAVAYYKAAVQLGNIDAIHSLGCLIADGEGFAQNYVIAEPYISMAAMKGIPDAQFRFAEMLDTGNGVIKNREEAVVWYKKALDGGERRAYLPLAHRFLEGETVNRNENIAAQYFIEAAEDGNVDAIFTLAKLFRDGVGVSKDAAKSESYFRKAAESNIPEAQYEYAKILQKKNNHIEAFKWLVLAAAEREYGDEPLPEVLFELGECYRQGSGTDQDKGTAFLHYHRAALAGYAPAKAAVAECYRKGIGVPVNKKAAAHYDPRYASEI